MRSGRVVDGRLRMTRATLTVTLFLIGILACCPLFVPSVRAQDGAGEDNLPRYWEIHAFLMSAGTILFVGTYAALWLKYVSRIKGIQVPALAVRVSKMWYRMHVYLGIAGVSLLVAGTILGYFMVGWAHNGQHLRLPHSYIGVIAGIMALVPLALGFTDKWGKRHKHSIRWWHIALGVAGIVIMLLGLFSGWTLE
jgi:integral membrane sensor domain MASE1